MEVKIEDNPIISRIWDEWMTEEKNVWSASNKDERLEICKNYQWICPKRSKMIDLECLFDSVHLKSNREKFKKWFYVVSGRLLSRPHLGENSYYHYQKIYEKLFGKEGSNSEEFPQMVLLVLAMLGYIIGLDEGYCFFLNGDNNHGYPFIIDKDKLLHWNCSGVDDEGYFITISNTAIPKWVMSNTAAISFNRKDDDPDRLSWTLHPDWLAERQYQSISSASVLEEGIVETSKWQFNYENKDYSLQSVKNDDLMKECTSYQKLRDLSCGVIGGCLVDNDKPDEKGCAGRFYSIMTNMKSEHRHKYVRLDGELVTEVDVSSAQPTFLGLMIYQEIGVMSEWLRQALNGTFYEWIKEKTCSTEDRKTIKKWMMQFMYSCYQPNKGKDYNKPHRPTFEFKKTEDSFLCFQQRLCKFLKKNEPAIYNKIDWYKRHPEYREDKPLYKFYEDEPGQRKKKKVGQGKWCSCLSYELVKMEVEYIRRCIRSLPEDMKFWTIHDCVCVKESDSLTAKAIMEQVSRQMYGEEVTMNLKRENTSEDCS